MAEDGVDLSGHTSNNIEEYRAVDFDFVITVCDNAKEHGPFFPSRTQKFHRNFPDPFKAQGMEAEIMQQFRDVFGQIRNYCKAFIQDQIS